MDYVIAPVPQPTVEVRGTADWYPVHRIYCVGRNHADHAREMGGDPEREPPFFFMKPADAVVPSGATIPYPPRTANFHHELELVIAIGKGGRDIPVERGLRGNACRGRRDQARRPPRSGHRRTRSPGDADRLNRSAGVPATAPPFHSYFLPYFAPIRR